jgi:serine/threonine protein kinase
MSTANVPGYRLIAELGAGASGVVYRAEQLQLGREVALKLVSPGLFSSEETRARCLPRTVVAGRARAPSARVPWLRWLAGARPSSFWASPSSGFLGTPLP